MTCKIKRDRCNLDSFRLDTARNVAKKIENKQKVIDAVTKKRNWGG